MVVTKSCTRLLRTSAESNLRFSVSVSALMHTMMFGRQFSGSENFFLADADDTWLSQSSVSPGLKGLNGVGLGLESKSIDEQAPSFSCNGDCNVWRLAAVNCGTSCIWAFAYNNKWKTSLS